MINGPSDCVAQHVDELSKRTKSIKSLANLNEISVILASDALCLLLLALLSLSRCFSTVCWSNHSAMVRYMPLVLFVYEQGVGLITPLSRQQLIPDRSPSRVGFIKRDDYMEFDTSLSSIESAEGDSLPTIPERPYSKLVSTSEPTACLTCQY